SRLNGFGLLLRETRPRAFPRIPRALTASKQVTKSLLTRHLLRSLGKSGGNRHESVEFDVRPANGPSTTTGASRRRATLSPDAGRLGGRLRATRVPGRAAAGRGSPERS